MPNDIRPKEIKITDKRIFTPEGEIREEFRNQVTPAEPEAREPAPPEEKKIEPQPAQAQTAGGNQGERRQRIADKASNPGTPFTNFVEPLIAQAYVSLGMLRTPYQTKPAIDVAAARQMIDIISLLQQKTKGNLTPDEEDFLSTHLGELKLAYVQRTKAI